MKRSLLVAVGVLVALLAFTATALGALPTPPFDTNSECLTCHVVGAIDGGVTEAHKVDFGVPGPVNLSKCATCHQNNYLTYAHEHFTGACENCHNGDDAFYFAWPGSRQYPVNTPYGYFLSPASLSATPERLHAVHSGNSSWVEPTFSTNYPACSTCHAPAACNACHDAPVAHTDHAVSTYPAVTYRQATGTAVVTTASTCVNPSCHALAKAGTAAFTPSCGTCHPSNVGDHGGDHSYSSASDYSEAAQSGCSNSGAGCHGTDSTYADMRSQYGHVGCTSGPCHISVSKPLAKAPLDCGKCHDGNYVGAPDRIALTGAYPNGHYNETTHTAAAMSRPITSGGSASASCSLCHAATLPVAHATISSLVYGSSLGCGECHNDTTTNGYLQVTANWSNNTCEDCHTVASAAPMHSATTAPVANATASAGCASSGAGCHATSNLHELHKNQVGCDLTGCHTLGAVPTKKSCGATGSDCHTGYDTTHYVAAKHTATGDIAGVEYGLNCTDCHSTVLPAAHLGRPSATCAGCHNATSPVNAVAVITAATPWAKSCTNCHTVKHDTYATGHQGQPAGTNTCMGAECHPNNSTDLRTVHTAVGCKISGCHDAANKDKRPTAKTCGTGGACHDGIVDGNHGGDHTYTPASDYNDAAQTGCTNSGVGCHGSDRTYANMRSLYGHTGCTSGPCHTSTSKTGVTGPLDCIKCHAGNYVGAPDRFALTDAYPNGHYNETTHTVPNGIMTTRYVSAGGTANAACIVCHDRTLPIAHENISSVTYGSKLSCAECHNDLGTSGLAQVQAGWTTDHCEDCHTVASAAPAHGAVAPVAAAVSPAGCAGSGVGCHPSTDLHGIHANASSCQIGCHTKDQGAILKSCGSADSGCHKYFDSGHYSAVDHTATGDIAGSETVACIKCHSAVLMPAHSGTGASTCSGCHGDASAAAVIVAGWDKNCSACHVTRHGGLPDHVGQPVAGNTCLGSGCHPNNSTNLMTVHSGIANSCELAGCHDAANKDKRPTKKTCGTGGACHDGKLDDNHGGDHSYTSDSDYNVATGTGCTNSGAGCHGADASYADIRTRYGHIGCTEGPCHTSASKPGVAAPLECAKCHAGNYAGAPNRTLGGTYPNGHYNETTHTAAAMNRTLGAGGSATAACSACHVAGMNGVHATITSTTYGSSLSCYECHNDTLSNGNAQVLAGWTNNTCDNCHKAGASVPMHSATMAPAVPATSVGCGASGAGCHNSNDLHALHKNEAGCGLTGCHTLGAVPTKKSCGAAGSNCHIGYATTHYVAAKHTATGDIAGTQYSLNCTDCHSTVLPAAHLDRPSATCAGCHNATSPVNAVGVITAATPWAKSCTNCHTVKHDTYATGHQGQPAGANTCVGSGCHPNNNTDLRTVHTAVGCKISGCHDAANKDRRPTKKTCGTGGACHNGIVDGNHGGDHSFTSASDYSAVTETGCTNSGTGCHSLVNRDIRAYHPGSGCQTGPCHNLNQDEAVTAPDECAKCHSGGYANAPDVVALTDLYPTGHYRETTHTATAMNRVLTAGGTASAQCTVCHDVGMKSVHASISVAGSPYGSKLSCVECHSDTRANGNSQVLANWSTNKCDDCHKVGSSAPMHGVPMAVAGSTTAGCTTGTGCHATDLHALHKSAASCALSGCHDAKNVKPVKKTCGTGGVCHSSVTGNHEAQHDTAGFVDTGCYGCHFQSLTREHAAINYTCSTCHSSTNTAVVAAIAASNRACDACHPAVNGKDYHKPQNETEFIGGNSSLHRVTSDLPGMRSSFKVGSTTYTWTLPTASSFLKAGWTTSSVVTCNQCHTYTGSAGPHGATMKVNIDPAFPGDYQTAYLGSSSPSPSNVICAKCHTNFSTMNQVHGEGDHQGSSDGKCVLCHTKVPHGWRLPRMLAYTSDPVQYSSTGLTGVSLANHSPSNWSENDCSTSCGEHSSSMSNRWPSTVVTIGNLAGTVTGAGGTPLAGVTVTTSQGQAGTTDAAGKYTFSGVSTGAYTVTAAKTGYGTQTKSATVNNNLTTAVSFTLVAIQPGTLSGTVTNASGGAALSGVTVQVTGGGSTSTAANGTYSLGLTAGTYTITYSKLGFAAQTKTVSIVSNAGTTQGVALVAAPTNMALGKTVTQSSSYSSSYTGAKAADGSTSTYWRSSSGGNQWIMVDLGSSQPIKRFVVDWNSDYYARSYRIETSPDNSTWTSRFSQSSSYTGDRTVTLSSAVTARYVRVYCTSAAQSSYQLAEFGIWDQ